MTSVSVNISRHSPAWPGSSQSGHAEPKDLANFSSASRLSFDNFRPLFGAAVLQEADLATRADFAAKLVVAKFALEQALNHNAPATPSELTDNLAQLVADTTFMERTRGHALTFTLAQAILSRTPESFSTEDQSEFAALVGAELFPLDLDGKGLLEEWILGRLDKDGEDSLRSRLARRGIQIDRLSDTNIWHLEQPRGQ